MITGQWLLIFWFIGHGPAVAEFNDLQHCKAAFESLQNVPRNDGLYAVTVRGICVEKGPPHGELP